jgi:hypothetical protein
MPFVYVAYKSSNKRLVLTLSTFNTYFVNIICLAVQLVL